MTPCNAAINAKMTAVVHAACMSVGTSAEDRLHLLRRQMKRLRVEKEVLAEEVATYHKKERSYTLTRRQLDLASERVATLQRGAAHTDAQRAEQAAHLAREAERANRLAAQVAQCAPEAKTLVQLLRL
jgi:hypothetical protein